MRLKRISKFVALVAVCGFLLGVCAASAAPHHRSKPKGHTGSSKALDKDAFLAFLAKDSLNDSGSCQSACCYAWFADCSGGSTSCSNTSCSWSCDGVGGGTYTCDAAAQ